MVLWSSFFSCVTFCTVSYTCLNGCKMEKISSFPHVTLSKCLKFQGNSGLALCPVKENIVQQMFEELGPLVLHSSRVC